LLDNFLTYLKINYPCNYEVKLAQYKKAKDKDLVGQIGFTGNTAQIDIIHWNRSLNKKLHTLAHEYKHALDGPKQSSGTDWEREISAEFFADKTVKEFLKSTKGVK
jgi:Zn-dependent peptidase ImmA (M78 family)